MDFTLSVEDFIIICFFLLISILIIITYFEIRFFTIKRKFKKINEILEEHFKKLTNIESKLTHKINKEIKIKEKNREQKLLKLKDEIEEMVKEGKR